MKKLLVFILFSLPFVVACSDDDNEMKVDLNNAVLGFIDSRYPDARIRSSEFENNGLLEVEIVHDGKVKELYFNSQSKWVYTSWDVRKNELPYAVTTAVAEAYPNYRIDEIDFIERETIEYYAVEMERGELSIMVYVSLDGEILEDSTGGSSSKPVISDAVRHFISEQYPDARIVEYGYDDNGLLKVEIIDGVIEKDVYFDSNDNWVQTDWTVPVDSMPDAVHQALADNYPQYFVDSAEYVERSNGVVYYEIELERVGGSEIVVNITPEGVILN